VIGEAIEWWKNSSAKLKRSFDGRPSGVIAGPEASWRGSSRLSGPPTSEKRSPQRCTGRAYPDPQAGQNLPFFAPSLLALRIRGGQSHPDQTPDGLGAGWMAGLLAAPFVKLPRTAQIMTQAVEISLTGA
jgi:hypothetical protein